MGPRPSTRIQAAPADTLSFDLIAADEYNTTAGLDDKLFIPTGSGEDRELQEGFYPWFIASGTDEPANTTSCTRSRRRRHDAAARQPEGGRRHQSWKGLFPGAQPPGQDDA